MSSFLKKILYIVIFTGLYYVLERYMKITTAFRYIQFSYAQPVMNFATVVYGPVVGTIASAFGEMFICMWKGTPLDWVAVACAALNCGTVGLAMIHSGVNDGFFMKKDVTRFNLTHFFSSMACWGIIYPGLSVLFRHLDFQAAINFGFGRFIGMVIMNFVAGTLLLSLYAKNRINAANFYRN